MKLVAETVQINAKLGRKDFDVPVPVGSFIVNTRTNESWMVRPWPERYRAVIIIGIGVLLGVGAAGAGYWIWRRRR